MSSFRDSENDVPLTKSIPEKGTKGSAATRPSHEFSALGYFDFETQVLILTGSNHRDWWTQR